MNRRRANEIRKNVERAAVLQTDEAALESVWMYPDWKPGTAYSVGFRVRMEGILYSCLTAHTSQVTWTPENAPSLWAKVLIPDPDVIPDWQQPDSTNAYRAGDKVRYDGKVWQSDVDNNVWAPGAFGWTELA